MVDFPGKIYVGWDDLDDPVLIAAPAEKLGELGQLNEKRVIACYTLHEILDLSLCPVIEKHLQTQ